MHICTVPSKHVKTPKRASTQVKKLSFLLFVDISFASTNIILLTFPLNNESTNHMRLDSCFHY